MSSERDNYSGTSTNYYEQQQMGSIEKATLAEDLELPELPSEGLSLAYLEDEGEYKLAFNEYEDMEAKFYVTLMTPTVDKTEPTESLEGAPNTASHSGSDLTTNSYSSTNYITLVIPKYILLNFAGTIPAGTEFIVASIGGTTNIEDMRIIGIYTTYASSSASSGGDSTGGTNNAK